MTVTPDPVGPGQESVWSYPRPAIAELSERAVRIEHCGQVIADSRACERTLETSHPPSWYVPPTDTLTSALRRSAWRSFCEWEGEAVYYDLVIAGDLLRDVAWSCPVPTPTFAILRDHTAFYAGPLDSCFVDGERVVPQPGTSTAAGLPPISPVRSRAFQAAASGERSRVAGALRRYDNLPETAR